MSNDIVLTAFPYTMCQFYLIVSHYLRCEVMSQRSKGRSCLKPYTVDKCLLLPGSCISTQELSSSNFKLILCDIVFKENDYFIVNLIFIYRIASILHILRHDRNESIEMLLFTYKTVQQFTKTFLVGFWL